MTVTKRILSLASMALMTLAILVAIGPRSQARAADCFNPYAVGPTESWHSIANVCGIDFKTLWDANPDYHRRGYVLITGDQLTLPGREGKPPGGLTSYTVQPGDSWYRIAQNHNLTFRDLRAFNPKLWLKRCIFIRPGDVMMLPWLGAPAAEAAVEPAAEPAAEPAPAEAAAEPAPAEAAAEPAPAEAAAMDVSGCPADLTIFGSSFMAGGLLQVVSATPFDLYVAEGDQSQVAGQAQPEAILTILTDVSCHDGWLWWQVTDESQGLTGWAAMDLNAEGLPPIDPLTQ